MRLSFIILPLLLSNCASPVYRQNPLIDQILKPRQGFDGKLTNRACLSYDGGRCIKEEIRAYDLSDSEFRESANKLHFICKIAGRRYKICLDKPGFCRHSYKESCFLFICSKGEKLEEYLPVSKYKFLMDSDAKCFNDEVYSFEDI